MTISKLFCTIILSGLLLSCNSQSDKEKATNKDSVIAMPKTGEGPDPRFQVTLTSFGLVKLIDTYEDIVKKYEIERVTEEKVNRAPESDETVTKTFINKGKPEEIVIQWDDNAFHKKIIAIEASQKQHPFKTADGIRYGTTMTELVKINGAKISFNGFNWGFAGLITDVAGGKLQYKEMGPNIIYEIDINATQSYTDITGDQVLNTDMPVVKKFLDNIFVYKIILHPAL
jgi:hypothetical protein